MTDAVTLLAAASDQQGPGNVLRILLLVSIFGAGGLAWLLLRGYRSDDGGDAAAAGPDGEPGRGAGPDAEGVVKD
ncbi:hypothetical protein AB0M57_21290 [Streptomyces sp. NPDC051597]|uniref:hypothetical protein n=1 Tax=Streptomyces sp. NPDC051597 TaxID=3155049 RepID=UPI00343215C5